MKLELKYNPEERDETKRRAYCASIFAVFPELEKDIQREMYEKLIDTYTTAVGITRTPEERDFEIIRGNGIMEGMAILLEKWKQAHGEHISNSKPEEEFDKHSPLPG